MAVHTPGHDNENFQSTQWSVVLRAGDVSASEEARAAMEQLCQTYWYPLYAYVRHRGCDPEDAQDVTQGFFTQLLSHSALISVDPEKGRFRAFLLASIKNYLRNFWRDANTVRRGGRVRHASIHDPECERRFQRQLSNELTAEVQFERDWAEALLQRAVARLRDDYAAADRIELFEVLQSFLVASGDQLPQAEIAEQFGLSLSAVKMSVHRMRKQYAGRVREEIASTLASPDDVDDELQKLIALVRHR